MLRELTTDDGAFAASQDADTDGIEGLTFTWRAAEIRDALGDAADLFAAAYGVTDEGNWEGVTILSRVTADDELATVFDRPVDEVTTGSPRPARACSNGVDAAAAGPRRQGAGGVERPGHRRLRRRGGRARRDR